MTSHHNHDYLDHDHCCQYFHETDKVTESKALPHDHDHDHHCHQCRLDNNQLDNVGHDDFGDMRRLGSAKCDQKLKKHS